MLCCARKAGVASLLTNFRNVFLQLAYLKWSSIASSQRFESQHDPRLNVVHLDNASPARQEVQIFELHLLRSTDRHVKGRDSRPVQPGIWHRRQLTVGLTLVDSAAV